MVKPIWVFLISILRVLNKGESQLLEVGLAGSTAGVFTHFLKDREQNGSKNCYNCNNNEKLDQCEAFAACLVFHELTLPRGMNTGC